MSAEPLLDIRGLSVGIDGNPLLSEIDMTVLPGEIHVIFGPNGSGKSTLIKAIMGLPPYRVTSGEIRFEGESIIDLPIDERARLGIDRAGVPAATNGPRRILIRPREGHEAGR